MAREDATTCRAERRQALAAVRLCEERVVHAHGQLQHAQTQLRALLVENARLRQTAQQWGVEQSGAGAESAAVELWRVRVEAAERAAMASEEALGRLSSALHTSASDLTAARGELQQRTLQLQTAQQALAERSEQLEALELRAGDLSAREKALQAQAAELQAWSESLRCVCTYP